MTESDPMKLSFYELDGKHYFICDGEVYTERCTDGKERHRLISARGLDPMEKKAYDEFIKSYTGTN